ncbi:IS701 family transposase [Rhizobium ruizarguesonis]|nr:IS701 family transposase [Rhizobium ruizarguesonis]TBA74421.1 IS701 family transposase [Rhizobium ruizarguesonis]TBA86654.1 IS701 family transposase [Rhizobium ruizarguesonis]TBA87031.1 IS701 family transposase [Rhizobium ruizarguesonis]
MSVSSWTGTAIDWERELSALKVQLFSVFRRSEARETCSTFIDGLLSGIERKTGWLMAEQAGFSRPWRIQALLGRSHWDAERMRDIVFDYVVETLGDPSGVLVVDETGFVKKGEHSVGVSRQYSGTAGRIENCQIGVFISYASRFGQALIDRRLYLPEAWATDEKRRKDASVPDEAAFATKPAMARAMLSEALDKGVPCAWVLADAAYGSDYKTRRMLEERQQPYVLSVRSNQTLRLLTDEGLLQTDPKEMADDLPDAAWQALPAGEGAKGLRLYDWARISLPYVVAPGFARYVLIRKSRSNPDAVSYYLVFAPAQATLADLAGAAGLRWTIEECFQRAKDDLGLDHCEARSWHGWHRHMTLVMAAAAFLTKLSADLRRSAFGKPNERSPNPSIAA